MEKINLAIVFKYLETNNKGEFVSYPGASVKNLPKNHPTRIRIENEEFEEFVECAYGIRFPKEVVTPHHKTPFEFVTDIHFERVKNALGFANRTGGKTYGVAVLNHLDILFKSFCEIASAGAVLDQTVKCYRYFTSFNESKWFQLFCKDYELKFGTPFVKKQIQSETRFANGSMLEIITGTEKGLRGPHPHKARIDEIDLMEWSLLQTALSMAQSSKGLLGQNVFTSTRQKAQGSMQRILESAVDKGIVVYQWDIWETLEKCNRRCKNDPTHGDCPIYTFCKGQAHYGDGFYSVEDFIEKVRVLDRVTFETEWLNLRPRKDVLVYHQFEEVKHVMTPNKLLKMFGVSSPSQHWKRFSGLDFGAAPGHPFVYLKICELPNGKKMVMHEYVQEQDLLRNHAQKIKKSPFYLASERIYSDWDAQDRIELQSHGIKTRPAVKEVLPGIDYVGSLLSGFPPDEEPALYVWYDCPYTIFELGAYSWPMRSDGRVDRSGLPKKDNDHAMDALRYAVYTDKKKGSGPKYRGYRAAI